MKIVFFETKSQSRPASVVTVAFIIILYSVLALPQNTTKSTETLEEKYSNHSISNLDDGQRVETSIGTITQRETEGDTRPEYLSVEIEKKRLSIRQSPTSKSKLRGVAVKGSRLPALEKSDGPGCDSSWYRVHDEAWICGDNVTLSKEPAHGHRYPIVPDGEISPWPYAFVREPAIEYSFQGGQLVETREVQKGYGFGVEKIVTLYGEKYFKTVEGLLVPKRAAGITSRLSAFVGTRLDNGKPWPSGWIYKKNAWFYSTPSTKKADRLTPAERYTAFEILDTSKKGKRVFYRTGENKWVSAKDARITTSQPLPKSIVSGERWIDVDLASQTITAYEGETPVYASLISSGRGGGSRTVKGEFRIWVKVSSIPMDNTDEELDVDEESENDAGTEESLPKERKLFSLHDVPWTQFFFENYALHGIYWHDRLGNRRSHGCVNLSLKDARWFYDWTEPRVPDGWWSIYTTETHRGTLVRIR